MFNLPLYQAMFKTFHGLRRVTRKDMQDFSLTQGTPKVLRSISKHPNCKLKEVAEDVDWRNRWTRAPTIYANFKSYLL